MHKSQKSIIGSFRLIAILVTLLVAVDLAWSAPITPTLGSKVGLTVLVDFSDEPQTIAQSNVVSFCNGDNYTGYGNNGSVKSYFRDVSNGKLTYTNVVTTYIRVSQPKSYYTNMTDYIAAATNLVADTITAMKALSNFDSEILPLFDSVSVDGTNQVLAFNLLYAGDNGGFLFRPEGLWPHTGSLGNPIELSPGGKKVWRFMITSLGRQPELGSFCHETGHLLCGYPELDNLFSYNNYSYDLQAGQYCLMSYGYLFSPTDPPQVCAYLKLKSGWATAIDLDASSSLVATVTSASGAKFNTFYRYAKPGTPTEYYLIENRFREKHDTSLPSSGVLVWHIDELGDNSGEQFGKIHNNDEAAVVQADNLFDLELGNNVGDPGDLYYQGNTAPAYRNQLSDTSSPNAHWLDGSNSGLVLRNFSAAGPTMTFVVGTNDPIPNNVVLQPMNQTLVAGSTNTFTVTVGGGFTPFTYQWRKQGAAIPGATGTSYTINNVQPFNAGSYSVTVANPYGAVTTPEAILVVIPTVPLPYALNNSNITWTTDVPAFWYGQTSIAHDGVASAQSPPLGTNQQSSLGASVIGPGTLSFWWRVSSQTNRDFLSFSNNGTNVGSLSGSVGWQQQFVYLPAGSHALQWTYSKDASGSSGSDAGWVDQVAYVGGPSAPLFSVQPVGQNIFIGTPVTLTAAVGGTPPLKLQWRLNGLDIPDATNATLSLASTKASDVGSYTLAASNSFGLTVSSSAVLNVLTIMAAGNNEFAQRIVPIQTMGAKAVSAGAWHNLALRSDGTVTAWGDNWNGQCNVPTNLFGVVAIAAGGYHSLALGSDGKVVGWGSDENAQATPPTNLPKLTGIAAGEWHSLGLRADGKVAAWGDNTWGQTDVPLGLANVIAVAAGGNHSLALRKDGTVVAWGQDIGAQGVYVGQATVPQGLTNVVAIAAGQYHSLALKQDGALVMWGDDSQGQCQAPANLPPLIGVAGGGSHTVALKADGTVLAWGNNIENQCNIPATISNITAVAAGHSHTILMVATPAPVQPLQIVKTARAGNQFSVGVQTLPGKNYALEYQDSLIGATWTSLPAMVGDGTLQMLSDPGATAPQRFYRVRQW